MRISRIVLALCAMFPPGFGSAWAASGGPDGGGYFWADHQAPGGPAYSWEDITVGGTFASTASGCDDCVQSGVPIGFTFDFYGNTYDTLSISSNGFIGFGTQWSSGCCSGGTIPSSSTPNNIIALWWEDLRPASGGSIYYQTVGAPGARRFIVSYVGVHHYFSGDPVDVQVKLFEGNDFIEVHYQLAVTAAGTHTAGIENENGSAGTQFYRGSTAMPPGTAVRYFRCTFTDGDGDGFDDCEDCDDTQPFIYPGAAEVCGDGIDTDCDGTDPTLETVDVDGDGFTQCDGDCAGLDPNTYTGAPEICDGIDNDCDGARLPDELDVDGDGRFECGTDCDDFEPTTFGGAPELCDGIDNDCNGSLRADEMDIDNDGRLACADDCDDFNNTVYTGAPELCDLIDNDCNGEIPPEEIDGELDGFLPCEGDCDDADPSTFPGAVELCDGIDNDCDGTVPPDEIDADDDGFMTCVGDCDDEDPWIFPGYVDLCDGLDNNCDGRVDEGLSHDADGDGHFTPGSCLGPADDCDDTTRERYPGNPELCDLVDNDCDELTDEGGICGGLGCAVVGSRERPRAPIGSMLAGLWAISMLRRRG